MNFFVLRVKHLLPVAVIFSFLAAHLISGIGPSELVTTILTITGILFAICIGFFITDLWSRFENIRANAAIEVSGLISYYQLAKILGSSGRHRDFLKKQTELINSYVKRFITVEWHEYQNTDAEFNAIFDSVKDIKELKTNKESETYSTMLPVLISISEARKKMTVIGQDRLSKAEWLVVISLSATLIFCLFYLKEPNITSTIFTGLLTTVILLLLLILQDLDDLSYGEETVSFEPYERIFDAIGKPRFYLKKDIESKRISLPKGKEYRVG